MNAEIPEYQAHDQSRSEGAGDRAERKAREAAFQQFSKSPASQEIDKLNQRLNDLEKKIPVEGRGGIRVTGRIVELIGNQVGKSGESSGTGSVDVQEEGSDVATGATFINFKGDIVEATSSGAGADVTIDGTVEPIRIIVGGVATDVNFILSTT